MLRSYSHLNGTNPILAIELPYMYTVPSNQITDDPYLRMLLGLDILPGKLPSCRGERDAVGEPPKPHH